MAGLSLGERLDALAHALAAGRDVLPEDVVARAHAVEERAGHRVRLSDEHTVVALAGATGSGKSSLLNALAGTPLAAVDVLRPTTSEALAVVRGTGAGELLDWLGVRSRHVLGEEDATAAVPGGLVLLDLPDHDSVRTEHRLEAERLVALVDLMVWVVDPQKYADAAIHERYLRGLVRHRDVLLVVLNQVDRLDGRERQAVERDLARLLADDGLAGVAVLGLSARTGDGVDALRDRLAEAAHRRRAARARTEADVADVAAQVLESCGDAPAVPGRARTELVDALERAAGVPVVVDAIGAAWRRRGREATGWPPTRWLARLRPDPLRRLHLGGPADPEVARSSLPTTGAAEHARARGAVREYTHTAAAGMPEDWAVAVHGAADTTTLPDALDHAVASTGLGLPERAAWWRGADLVQWLLVIAMVAGLGWWGAIAVAERLAVPLPAPPVWGEVPWPTVALLGGAALGLLVAGVARLVVAAGARRRARHARARLRTAVGQVADHVVVEPVETVLARHAACREAALRALHGRG